MTFYFAYGSNLSSRRIRAAQRAPKAHLIGVAILEGYLFKVHKRSRDGSGKCDVVISSAADARVYGVVWDLHDGDLRSLDRVEGVGQGYARGVVEVELAGRKTAVETYRAAPEFVDPSLEPFDWYMSLVLAGAEEHRLPDAYRRWLAEVPVRADPDRRRARRALAILGR